MASISVGSVSVDVVPNAKKFSSDLTAQLTPTTNALADSISKTLSDKIAKGIKDGVDKGGQEAIPPASTQGSNAGKTFADSFKRQVDRALASLPDIKINADSTEAEQKIAAVRAELDDLSKKTVGVDINDADAVAKLDELRAKLDEIGAKSDSVSVKADTGAASAELDKIRAKVDELNGKTAEVKVDDNGSAASTNNSMGTLLSTIMRFAGMAVIFGPLAGGVAGIGAAAGVAAAGLPALMLGLSGISGALQAVNAQQTTAATSGAQMASQQISSANGIASAQQGLVQAQQAVGTAAQGVQSALQAVQTAIQGVGNAEQGVQNAMQTVANAQQGVGDAYRNAADAIHTAAENITSAENTLANAQYAATTAQLNLTNARLAAAQAMETLNFQVQDGALQQRQDILNVANAQTALTAAMRNPASTATQRAQAQLSYDQATQALTEIKAKNEDLATQKAKSDQQGVSGSQSVIAAEHAVGTATQAVATAEQKLADTRTKYAQQEIINQENIGKATQAVGAAVQGVERAQQSLVAAQQNVAKAQQGVVTAQQAVGNASAGIASAQRALQAAYAAAGAQGAAANQAVAAAMSQLAPAGQNFVRFLSSLKPQFDALKASAEGGLLPGLQKGLEALLPVMPQITANIGTMAKALGGFFATLGQMAASPAAMGFFTMLSNAMTVIMPQIATFAGQLGTLLSSIFTGLLPAVTPALQALGSLAGILSNLFAGSLGQTLTILAKGLASLIVALAPGFDALGKILLALAPLVAQLAGALGQILSAALVALVPVIQALVPPFMELVKQLGGPLVDIVRALAPVLGDLAKIIGQNLATELKALAPLWPILVDTIKLLINLVPTLFPLLSAILPAFTQLASALISLLPPILQLLQFALPPLVALLVTILVPTITWVANVISNTLAFTIKFILLPVLSLLIDAVTNAGNFWQNVWAAISAIFLATVSGFVTAGEGIFNSFMGFFHDVLNAFIGFWIDVWNRVQSIFWATVSGFINAGEGLFNGFMGFFHDVLNAFIGFWLDVWRQVSDIFWATLSGFVNAGEGIFNGFMGFSHDLWVNVTNFFVNVWRDAVNSVQTIWDGLKKVFGTPVEFVIRTVLNDGLIKGINTILGAVGIPNIPNIPDPNLPTFATGGVVAGRDTGKDTVHAMLRPGEGVLIPEVVQALGGESAIHALNSSGGAGRPGPNAQGGYDNGGIIGNIGSFFSDVGSAVGNTAVGAWDGLKNVALGGLQAAASGFFDTIIKPLIGQIPGNSNNVLKKALGGEANKIETQILTWLGGKDSSGGGSGNGSLAGVSGVPAASGGAQQAQAYASSVLGQFGWGQDQMTDLIKLWNQESGWNANAVNASSGAYGIPQSLGHGHPYNLGDYANQIQWGLSYIKGRYGSPNAAWAHEVSNNWYDAGGIASGVGVMHKNTLSPERVLSPQQTRSFDTLIPLVESLDTGTPGNTAGRGGNTINVNGIDYANASAIASEVERQLTHSMR